MTPHPKNASNKERKVKCNENGIAAHKRVPKIVIKYAVRRVPIFSDIKAKGN